MQNVNTTKNKQVTWSGFVITVFTFSFALVLFSASPVRVRGQQENKAASPTPSPSPANSKRTVKRTSGVKVEQSTPAPSSTPTPAPENINTQKAASSPSPSPSPTPSSPPKSETISGGKSEENASTPDNKNHANQPSLVKYVFKVDNVLVNDATAFDALLSSIKGVLSSEKLASIERVTNSDEISVTATEEQIKSVRQLVEDAEKAAREKARLSKEREEKEKADKLAAAELILQRERQLAADEAVAKERAKFEEEQAKLKAEAAERERLAREEKDRLAKQAQEEKEKLEKEAEAEKNRIAQQAEEEKQKLAKEFQAEKEKKDNELLALKKQQEESQKAQQELAAKLESEKLAREEKAKAEQIAKEAAERERAEKAKLRLGLIEAKARELKFVNPDKAYAFVQEEVTSEAEIEKALKEAVAKDKALVTPPKKLNFCDADFSGDVLDVDFPGEIPLWSLLQEIRDRYNVNFLPDSEVANTMIRVNVNAVPWNYVLRSVLSFNDLSASCGPNNTIQIVKRTKQMAIQENLRKSAPLVTEFIKTRFLRPRSGGIVNVAGQSQNSAGDAFESLEAAINKIIRAEGDNRGSVSRIPGRNEFFITATSEQMTQIKAVIARADRPTYLVFVQAYTFSGNRNKIKDKGLQGNIIAGTGDLSLLGGILTQPSNSGSSGNNSGSGGSSGGSNGSDNAGGSSGSAASQTRPGDLVPGGVRTLGPGFAQPNGQNGIFGISSIIGTTQFSLQATVLEQKGIIKVESYPSIFVQDGGTSSLDIGRQIPVVVQGGLGPNGGASVGSLEVLNAGNTLEISPQVAEDENGNPTYVSLNLRLEVNDVDTSVVTNGVPSVIRRSSQTQFVLKNEQVVIFGGFKANTDSKTKQKSFWIFRRNVSQESNDEVYFALAVRVIRQDEYIETLTPPSGSTLPNPAPPSKLQQPQQPKP